jgi:hypothetical protein
MGELPHVRDTNLSEADDEDGLAESSTHEATVLTLEPDRMHKHPFYVIWVHGMASQYCLQAQANKQFQLRLGSLLRPSPRRSRGCALSVEPFGE